MTFCRSDDNYLPSQVNHYLCSGHFRQYQEGEIETKPSYQAQWRYVYVASLFPLANLYQVVLAGDSEVAEL